MKKILKYLFINIFIIILGALIVDYIYFQVIFHQYKNDCIRNNVKIVDNIKYNAYDIIKPTDETTTDVYKYFLEYKHYHATIIPKNDKAEKKAPIILFGDSYTWLFYLMNFQKLLSDYTNRTIFNFAFWGWGAQHTYYLINKPLLYKIIDENSKIPPEYAVYTYIRDHRNRLFPVLNDFNDFEPYLTYEMKNNKLQQKKYNFLHALLFRSFIYRHIMHENRNKSNKEKYDELYNLVSQSYIEIKKHYPDIKYIVFEYYQDTDVIQEENEFFKKLENIGIKVISSKELTKENLLDKKYTFDDGYHPNEKAWEILTKPLAKAIEKY